MDYLIHFGPSILFLGLTLWAGLDPITAFIIDGLVTTPAVLLLEEKRPIVKLPPHEWRDLYNFFLDSIVYGLFVGIATIFFTHSLLDWIYPTDWGPGWIPAFILTDLSYYLLHRLGYHSWLLYKLHTLHHQVLHLDLLRGNAGSLIDQGILSFQLPLAIWGWLFGANLYELLIVYSIILFMQTSHHLNLESEIGWLRYIFVDSHAHKLHHCLGGTAVNFGGVLSVWDHLFGTYCEDKSISPNELHEKRIIFRRKGKDAPTFEQN